MLDLTCVSSNIIGSIGSAFFVGFAISCSFVPRLADNFGRKKPFFISLLIQLIAYILMFVSRSIYFTIFLFLVVGLASGGRIVVGTMYLNEFIPNKYQK